jgi:four helix bundle protein
VRFVICHLSLVIGHWLLVIGYWLFGDAEWERYGLKICVFTKSRKRLADLVWDIVNSWDHFPKDTVGKQLVRSVDSIGANISEGSGCGTYKQNRYFVRISRGSLFETRHWLRRAYNRQLISDEQTQTIKPLLDELAPTLNAYLNSIGKPNDK